MNNFFKTYLKTLGILVGFLTFAIALVSFFLLFGTVLYTLFGLPGALIGVIIALVLVVAAVITFIEMSTRY